MKYDITLERIANCYYNLGLERARLRDLSGAAELLKKALHFDKYQREARNLLGLIFFEMGEVADALVQWVISMNLLPEDNPADYFLEQIQRKPAILRICSDNVKRYNQALDYAQHNNEDLAVFQLNQVIGDSPNYVKAHILLSLLYMRRSEWVKAGKSLYLVLKIDRNNPKALVLMDYVKKKTGRAEVEQSRLRNVFSHRKMMDDDVMMPQEVKQISPWAVSALLLLGVVIALFVFYLLMLPAGIRRANSKNNQEMISYTEKLDAANQKMGDLSAANASLQKEYDEMKEKLDRYENQNASFMAQYQSLVGINNALSTGDLTQAAQLYTALDQSAITDESLVSMLSSIKSQMEGSVYLRLQELGSTAWNAGRLEEALQDYTWSVKIRREAENLFLLARIQQTMGNTTEANQNFDSVVGEFPEFALCGKGQTGKGILMLDQRKIIAMVQVAMLEKEIGQEALDTAKYYREDYISNRVLRGILQYTGIFFLLLLAYFLMEIENILQKLDFQYMMDLGKRISLLYFLGMVCAIVLISIVSYYSYERAYEDSLLYRERLEDLLLLSTAKRTEKFRKKEEKDNIVQKAREEAQEVVLQMKKEGAKLDLAPLYTRSERLAKARKLKDGGKTVQKNSSSKAKGEEEWLDDEADWLDE